jgi:hypothetical protein
MRRLVRLLLLGGVIAGLAALLRKLFVGGIEPLVTAESPDLSGIGTEPPSGPGGAEQNGGAALSREQLYEEAKRLDIEGRSKMNKSQLQRAVAQRGGGGP